MGAAFAEQKSTLIRIAHTKTKDTVTAPSTLQFKYRLETKINTAL